MITHSDSQVGLPDKCLVLRGFVMSENFMCFVIFIQGTASNWAYNNTANWCDPVCASYSGTCSVTKDCNFECNKPARP